ncbi:hypothetical protein EVAR_73780_1 [Eumeta japonica]|uniref:Uncharacterized protein n=1 Tax=Eumeta variegata TaxID=151549 RepID=A0A4C1ZZY5_EUMVA|nr:hypothetical protein EVAR_73780_1 [Eumeta japonica]
MDLHNSPLGTTLRALLRSPRRMLCASAYFRTYFHYAITFVGFVYAGRVCVSSPVTMSCTAFESPPASLCSISRHQLTGRSFLGFGQIMSLYHEPHCTDAVFGLRHRRTSLAQIISQISATTLKLVEPVINNARDGPSS